MLYFIGCMKYLNLKIAWHCSFTLNFTSYCICFHEVLALILTSNLRIMYDMELKWRHQWVSVRSSVRMWHLYPHPLNFHSIVWPSFSCPAEKIRVPVDESSTYITSNHKKRRSRNHTILCMPMLFFCPKNYVYNTKEALLMIKEWYIN